MCNVFLGRYAEKLSRPAKGFSEEAMDILMGYEFPGNVRELENIMERAVVLCNGEFIEPAHLPEDMVNFQSMLARPQSRSVVPLKENERDYISWVIDQFDGNKTHAADALEVDRATLWRKLKRLGIEE